MENISVQGEIFKGLLDKLNMSNLVEEVIDEVVAQVKKELRAKINNILDNKDTSTIKVLVEVGGSNTWEEKK